MENTKVSFIEEEIFYYPAKFNFGISSKNKQSPKNIYMSFSPFSTNQKNSFSNTIMIPFITTQTSMETKEIISQNISSIQNEKSKLSIKNESTRLKTESSKEEKNNISIEKQVTKILVENDITENNDENTNEIDTVNQEKNENKNILEKNPFFLGDKLPFYFNKFQNDNSGIEEKKMQMDMGINSFEKENDSPRRQSCHLNIKKNTKNKIKRMKSSDIAFIKKTLNSGNEDTDKKKRKNEIKYKTSSQNKINRDTNNIYKIRISYKNLPVKKYKMSPYRKKRQNTVRYKPANFKDKNIKSNKTSLFNKNSRLSFNFKDEKNKDKTDEKETFNKGSKRTIKYKGISQKSLLMGLEFGIKKENKLNKKNEENVEKKGNIIKIIKKQQESINNSLKKKLVKKHTDLSNLSKNIKRMKTFNANEKDKVRNSFRKKNTKIIKNIDFELELKKKNNLAKTQFNLFSPDKFTNTQFCGSDYCEYTLDCMDIILKRNQVQKQQKNKVNFNFPKTAGSSIKKRIALFDLDETLVHCTGDINKSQESNIEYQHCIDVILPGNKETKVGINIRPFWKKTLNLIKKYYHIVAYTASHQAYADAVLNFMDPTNKYFKYRLYRNNCSLVDIEGNKFYVKDLDIFDEHYDLKDIILIDNSVLSFIYHLENGIPIVPYYNEDKDGSLYVVGLYLMHIFKEDDLREANKKYINLESYLNEARIRKDLESTFNEESFNIDINLINEVKPILQEIDKDTERGIVRKVKTNTGKGNGINIFDKLCNKPSIRRCSFAVENTQHKLISQSKLINMYYEVNNNRTISDKNKEEIIEERSNKSLSVVDEQENKKNEMDKDIVESFYKKRSLTDGDKPTEEQGMYKSNKTVYNHIDINMIRSNFYNSFSEEGL